MLPVFLEMISRGYAPEYDKRYTYTFNNSIYVNAWTYTDNGNGFWYEGEPEQLYHGPAK